MEIIAKHIGGEKTMKGPPKMKPQYDELGRRIPPPLAVLPKHLVPKALGGEAQDVLGSLQGSDAETIGRKNKNRYAALKKITTKDDFV